jgi:predicted NBD/HSP70 family sugar kinase
VAKEISVGINTARILRSLWSNRIMSRTDLSRQLGIDKSTVSKLINDLNETGLISNVSEGEAGPTGGRRPLFLSLNPDYGAVLGLEIQTDFYVAVLVNFHGRILYTVKKEFSLGKRSITEAFCSIYTSLNPGFKEMDLKVIGAVIGAGGIINPYKGIIYQSNPLNLKKPEHIYEALDACLDIPVLVENDANCGAWGEIAFSRLQDSSPDFIYILGETRNNKAVDAEYNGIAIGTSIVFDHKVHYGQDFSSGEFQSLFRSGDHLNQFNISDEEAGIYEENEELFLKVAHELSRNIAFLVNMLNLKEVVLGGRIEYHPEIVDVMQEEISRNWSYDSPIDVNVRFSNLKEQTVAYGAAGMFFEQLFSLPDVSASKKQEGGHLLRERAARGIGLKIDVL